MKYGAFALVLVVILLTIHSSTAQNPCQYCPYCKYCPLCEDCPCEGKAHCPMCKYCSYCNYCSMCKVCADKVELGGIFGSRWGGDANKRKEMDEEIKSMSIEELDAELQHFKDAKKEL